MSDPKGTSAAGPVVICCASPDADTIRSVVEDLEGEGHTVALLDGIENDLDLLAPTVESFCGEGLYVLCRSKALGRRAVDELRDVLLAHHVPFGRTLTVASTRPKELRERIGASLRRLSASGGGSASTQKRAARATRLGMAPGKSPKPKGDEDAASPAAEPRAARKTQLGLEPPRPTKPKPKPKSKPKSAAPKVPAPPKTVGPAAAKPQPESSEAEPPANLVPAVDPEAPESPPDPSPAPITDPLSGAVIQADELADLDALVEAADAPAAPPPVRSGNTQVVPAIPRSQLEAIRTGNTAIVSREALLAAGLDVEGEDGDDDAQTSDSALGTGLAATPASPLLPPPSADDEGPSGPPWRWIGIGGAALAVVAVIAIAVGGSSDDRESDDDALAQADEARTSDADDAPDVDDADGTAESKADGTNEGDDPTESDAEAAQNQRTRIGHALRSRTVRSLDVLLVSNTTGPLSWSAAAEHCEGLDVEGISSWRLPEVGELMSLSGASMTERGYYWTATPADTFGDTRLAWYARRSRVVPRSRESLALCVRGGPASG